MLPREHTAPDIFLVLMSRVCLFVIIALGSDVVFVDPTEAEWTLHDGDTRRTGNVDFIFYFDSLVGLLRLFCSSDVGSSGTLREKP